MAMHASTAQQDKVHDRLEAIDISSIALHLCSPSNEHMPRTAAVCKCVPHAIDWAVIIDDVCKGQEVRLLAFYAGQ